MRWLKQTCYILMGMICLNGCGAQGIDGASDETFQTSIESLKQGLPDADRLKFDKALEGLQFIFSENALVALADSSRIKERIRTRLNGMTIQDVIDLWDERLAKEIKALKEKKTQNEAAQKELRKVVVQRSLFKIQRNGQRVVEIRVKNDTEHTISHIYFRGVLTSPGRRGAWVEDYFHYGLPEGLKSGDSATWSFALLAAAWEQAPADREDLQLTVYVTRIDGEDREPVYDAQSNPFSRQDQRRLDRLMKFQKDQGADKDAA